MRFHMGLGIEIGIKICDTGTIGFFHWENGI